MDYKKNSEKFSCGFHLSRLNITALVNALLSITVFILMRKRSGKKSYGK